MLEEMPRRMWCYPDKAYFPLFFLWSDTIFSIFTQHPFFAYCSHSCCTTSAFSPFLLMPSSALKHLSSPNTEHITVISYCHSHDYKLSLFFEFLQCLPNTKYISTLTIFYFLLCPDLYLMHNLNLNNTVIWSLAASYKLYYYTHIQKKVLK